MKINHKLNTRLLGGVSVGLLVLLVAALICPLGESARAEDEGGSGMAMAQNAVDVKSMIAVALDSLVSTEVVPTSAGGVSAAVANMTVTTNSPNGFSVSMNGVNGTDLKAADKNNTAVIRSTTKSATLANFDANTWGFYIGEKAPAENAEFRPVPSAATEIESTENNGMLTDYKLAFGTKVDPTIPAGTYAGSVVVSAVANPITVTSLMQLTYMQDMTTDICANTLSASEDIGFKQNPITKQLIDTRDGKSYWVAKLADGKCWMTQNLDFDIKVNEDGMSNVRAEDTDVPMDWTNLPPAGWNGWKTEWNELAKAAFGTAAGSDERTALAAAFADSGWKFVTRYSKDKTRYYDYFTYDYTENGEAKTATYYPPYPTQVEIPLRDQNDLAAWLVWYSFDFGKVMSGILPTNFDYMCSAHDMQMCANKGIIDVGNAAVWTGNFTAQEGSYTLPDGTKFEGTILANQENHTYDAHYLFGNYYQLNAVTAKSGAMANGSSICPKNWRLPSEDEGQNDFSNLLAQYGAKSGVDAYKVNATLAPLSFPMAGLTWTSSTTDTSAAIYYMNGRGRYFSTTVGYADGTRMISLVTTANNSSNTMVQASGDDTAFYPHTVRCLAR